jgi:hypothetical protein
MEFSTSTVAHMALDQMITANILLTAIEENGNTPVPAVAALRTGIMQLMEQFNVAYEVDPSGNEE